MIKQITLQNFKRFNNHTFSFRPDGVTLLAGGNNSGKSTVLHALALWQFCRGIVQAKKGMPALQGQYSGAGIPINSYDFSPLAIPTFEHLWTNLNSRSGYVAGQANAGYTLRIGCSWDEASAAGGTTEHSLTFGLTLSHERLYIKPISSTVPAGARVPTCAYLPSFAGLSDREERMSKGAQQRLIGRGLAGATLRNILFDLHREYVISLEGRLAGRRQLTGEQRRIFNRTEPWSQLSEVLRDIFRCELRVQPFDDAYSVAVRVFIVRGNLQNGRLRPFAGYKPRDVMVEGSGFLQWLSVYTLAVRKDVDVLLLDEPDAHLHPSLQGELLDRLRSLARENNKQVLMATHASDLLKRVEPSIIYEFGEGRRRYLATDAQRTALLAGIGSEYCPKLDQLRRYRRVLFHEGPSDEELLRLLAQAYGRPLPSNLVFWQFGKRHQERKILFDFLAQEVPLLKAISLIDRDSLNLGDVGPDLAPAGIANYGELRARTWRRRQIENYLLAPEAIARCSRSLVGDIEKFLQEEWGIPCGIGVDLTASDCSPGLRDARAKEALYEGISSDGGGAPRQSVQQRFGCSRHDIARNLQPHEIAADVKTLVDEIHLMCAA